MIFLLRVGTSNLPFCHFVFVHAAPEPLGVAFSPAAQTLSEQNVTELPVEVCFVVSGSIMAPFSVIIEIDQTLSTATLGE